MRNFVIFLKCCRLLIDVLIVLLLPFAWILRDGLGPSAQTSYGLLALFRTLMIFRFWSLIAISITLHLLIILIELHVNATHEETKLSHVPLNGKCIYLLFLLIIIMTFVGSLAFWSLAR